MQDNRRKFVLKRNAGDTVSIEEEITIPGDWYFVSISRFHSDGPFQKPARKCLRYVGWAYSPQT